MNLNGDNEQGAWAVHLGGAGVCAVLLASGWLLGLSPLLSESQQQYTAIQEADQVQEKARLSKAALDQLQSELEHVKQKLRDRPVSLEPATQINPLLAELAGWADDHALTITRTHAGRPVSLAYYDYVPIKLEGEGAYADLLGLMHRLHAGRGDLGVVAFNAKRKNDGGRVAFGIELTWYVLSAANETAAVPTD